MSFLLQYTLSKAFAQIEKITKRRDTVTAGECYHEGMFKPLTKHPLFFIPVLALGALLSLGLQGQAGELYRQTQYKTSYQKCDRSQDNCSYYQVEYPILAAQTPAGQAINRQLYSAIFGNSTPEQQAAQFLKDYAKDGQQGAVNPWALQRQVQIEAFTERLVSLRDYTYDFRGGAHGNHLTQFYNFDLQTGRKLSLNDLFRTGYEKPLTALAEQIFREQNDLTPQASLAAANYTFPNNRFVLSKTILITAMGLVVHYNPYEIASFSQGTTEIEVPFYQLEDWLKDADKPNSLINQLQRL